MVAQRNALREAYVKATGRQPSDDEIDQLEDEIFQAARQARQRYYSDSNAIQNLKADFPSLANRPTSDVELYSLKFGQDLSAIATDLLARRLVTAVGSGIDGGAEQLITAPLPTKVGIFMSFLNFLFRTGGDAPVSEPVGGVVCSVSNQGCNPVVNPPH